MDLFNTALFVAIFIFKAASAQEPSPIVQTKYGSVQGKTIPLHDGNTVNSFLGIPFARAPVGELRFMVSNMN